MKLEFDEFIGIICLLSSLKTSSFFLMLKVFFFLLASLLVQKSSKSTFKNIIKHVKRK